MPFRAEVKVTLRPGVLDPQGAAVERALRTLGYEGVREVRVGKVVELWLDAADEAEARAQVEAMGRRLLANPVLERFTFTLAPAGPGDAATRSAALAAPAPSAAVTPAADRPPGAGSREAGGP
ncbi:MAG: phosphoribosylformylglycinamidine synthase subunit PurS [Bacillota bacterium]